MQPSAPRASPARRWAPRPTRSCQATASPVELPAERRRHNSAMSSPLPLARFRPRLIDALAGYDRQRFLKDLGAGVTVGIVALPLAMAFAIASGLKPEAGIWTAIIAGFLIAALGG